MIVPITRKEKLLNAIATNGDVDFLPKTREELFLFKILGADVNTPTPITRKELLYQHIIDGTIPTFEPRTRLEKFIMAAAGVGLELPVVLTREEYWWAEISDSAYKTITGAIVHFISKRARAIKSLIANISYTQDLHGYDSPWPAGGGKNLLWLNNGVFKTGAFHNTTPREVTGVGTWVGISASNYLAPNSITSYTIGDNSLTVESTANGYGVGFECKLTAGQQYTLSWVGTNAFVGISFYGSNGEYLSYVTSGVSPKTFTVPESTAGAIIVLRGDGANVTGEFSNVQLEEGQTATAYSPYANICPISGWTGANVTRTGKNLIDIPASVTKDGITFTKDSDGYVTASPNSGDPRSWGKNNAQFLVNLAPGNYKFVIKLKTPSASQYSGWEIYSPTGVKIAGSSGGKFQEDEVAAFTASESGNYYIMAKLHTSVSRLMVVKDGADTSNYEPYSGDTYSITFPSEAGTVYGGTLDLVSGLLTINRTTVNTTWGSGINATNLGHVTRKRYNLVNPSKKYYNDAENDLKSNVIGQYNTMYSSDYVHMYLASTTHIWAYMPSNTAADTVMQFSYTLETPVTYQLTPTEVATLLGDNTIWADTGDVSVTY